MRLILALMLAATPAIIAELHEANLLPVGDHPLQTHRAVAQETGQNGRNGAVIEEIATTNEDDSDLNWFFRALNRVLLYVLFGWAVGRLLTQFRRIIVVTIGVIIIADMLLYASGLLIIQLGEEPLDRLFMALKELFWGMGFIDFFAVAVGVWAGVMGQLVAERRQRAVGAA